MKAINKRLQFLIINLCFVVTITFAQYNPPSGGEDGNDFLSAYFLGAGGSLTSQEGPFADYINPAASALKQRFTLDLSYLTLVGTNGTWPEGHIGNLGLVVPSKYGNFSSSIHFLTSADSDLPLGTFGDLSFSFSKDIFPTLLFGAGTKLRVGSKDTFDYGVVLDLGILHMPGDLSFFHDFQWGFVLKDIGKWYDPSSEYSSFPSPFTPGIGFRFTPVDEEAFHVDYYTDLYAPTFQNVKIKAGLETKVADFIEIFGSVQADIVQVFDSSVEMRSFIPSFGIGFSFSTDFEENDSFISQQGWNKSEVKTRFAAAPLYGDTWGIGGGINVPLGVIDSNPPQIVTEVDKVVYISPNNDGISDFLEFPFTVEDERYIKGYSLTITTPSGEVVRTIINKDDRPENLDVQNVLDRLFYVKQGISVPEKLSWNGYGESGAVVEDGTYQFGVSSFDDNHNIGKTDLYTVVVDNTIPSVELVPAIEDKIFSPNDDGNKDTFLIEQSGTEEVLWSAQIVNQAGGVVRTVEWKNMEPESFIWDGTDNEGSLVADGVYQYKISSIDLAGNSFETTLQNILVDTEPRPVTLDISTANFSPNNDNVKDNVAIDLSIPVTRGIKDWSFTIKGSNGKEVLSMKETELPPGTIVFSGVDNSGRILPEDSYKAYLSINYNNGSSPSAESASFVLDITAPKAQVRSTLDIISPNQDGHKDELTIFHSTSTEDLWTGTIVDSTNNVVASYQWRNQAPTELLWNGQVENTGLLSDGVYRYIISAEDRAGNRGSSNEISLEINTQDTPVLISTNFASFSPNNDRVKDVLEFYPQLKVNTGIERYDFSITSNDDRVVFSQERTGNVPETLVWNGANETTDAVTEGIYSATLTVYYENGNEPVAKTSHFEIDTQFPELSITSPYRLFSPNNDGIKDEIRFDLQASSENLWEGIIAAEDGSEVRYYYWDKLPDQFVWDATDEDGNKVRDGVYSLMISSTDRAGNETTQYQNDIVVDARPTEIFLLADQSGFSPNNDGKFDTLQFTLITGLTEGIEDWSLTLTHENGTTVKTWGGDSIESNAIISWNGKGEDSELLEGRYTADFEVRYEKGDNPKSRITDLILDVTGPAMDVTLAPVPFSPDHDGIDDELEINLNMTDISDIAEWNIDVFDPNKQPFMTKRGAAAPAESLMWDGRSDRGDYVLSALDYPFTVKSTDVLGNTSEYSGQIPVDILVNRIGNQLKIQISNINFEPDKSELPQDNSERGRRNSAVLDRLAKVLTKYGSYKITIEGHGVNIYGTKEYEDNYLIGLSRARANVVRDALIDRGIDGSRISFAGKGGTEPLVPHNDYQNRWKNRRVEFILVKE